jgi:hypothetical protein
MGASVFTGFGSLESGLVSKTSGFTGEDAGDNAVSDADFNVVLKRLSKKDATTKLKVV